LVGLAQLDDAEADYLQPLQELLASGMSQAEQTIARYQPGGEWATGAESIDLRPLVRLKGCPFAEDEPLLP
jgi:hypothetical protein